MNVGLLIAPVMPGLSEEELGLGALLTRASNAGARFAGLRPLELPPAQRESFFQHVNAVYPELAMRLRRVVGIKPPSIDVLGARVVAFDDHCARLGLLPFHQAVLPRHPPPGGSPFAAAALLISGGYTQAAGRGPVRPAWVGAVLQVP